MSSIPNYDAEAGIHFGFIYQNHVDSQEVHDRIISNGTDLGYESMKQDTIKRLEVMVSEVQTLATEYEDDLRDILNTALGDVVSHKAIRHLEEEFDLRPGVIPADDTTYSDLFGELEEKGLLITDGESGPYRYEQDGYLIDTTSDNGLFILKSPYFTYCRECSPCAPNAGYLKSQPGSMKAYCLGADWFDEYSPLPYTVYSVETGEVVTEEPKEEEEK